MFTGISLLKILRESVLNETGSELKNILLLISHARGRTREHTAYIIIFTGISLLKTLIKSVLNETRSEYVNHFLMFVKDKNFYFWFILAL